jgi:hypothetical protein
MLKWLLTDSLLSLIMGNIYGWFRHVIKRENPVWVSKYYFQYKRLSDYWLVYLWAFLVAIGAGFFYFYGGIRNPITTFLFLTGFVILIQLVRYLDRFYIFRDRFERRFFFHRTEMISFDQVYLVLRDKSSGRYADVIFRDDVYDMVQGISQGSAHPWRIPVEAFAGEALTLDKHKLHKNLQLPYEEVKNILPDLPIKKRVIPWSEQTWPERILPYSVLLFNPYTFAFVSMVWFGAQLSIWLLIALDLVRYYPKWIIRQTVSSLYTFDEEVEIP